MKAKVLYWEYDDKSSNGIERLYFKPDFTQADKDLDLLNEHSADKKFKLLDVDVYNADKYTYFPIENKELKNEINPNFKINNDTKITDIFRKRRGDYSSARILNLFKVEGIQILGDLLAYSEDEVLEFRNVSYGTLSQINNVLEKHNLKLRQDA